MTKVLHVIRSLALGGAERVVTEFALAHDRDRFDPEICCVLEAGPLASELRQAGVPVHVLRRRGRVDVRSVFALATLVRRRGIGVVHNHNLTALMVGVPGGVLGGARAILRTEHNVATRPPMMSLLASRFASLFEDAQIGVSEAVRETHRRSGRIPARRFVTIRNGIDDARLRRASTRKAMRAELGISDDTVLCLTVGSLTLQKDHENLLEAASRLLASRADVAFAIAGEGPLQDGLRQRVDELGLGERVQFLGRRTDVPDLLRAADIFVLSSAWEGLPITILEAMASGVPCVATTVGGNAEAIEDGVSGFLVPPHDPETLAGAIDRAAADGELRLRIGRAGRLAYESRFTADKMARQTEALYRLSLARASCLAPDGKIRVLFVIRQLDYGGAERQLVELATRLPRDRFDAMVCCLCPPGPLAVELEERGITVVSTHKKLGALSTCSWALLSLVREFRPAVLHSYLFSANWRSLSVGRVAGVPLVVTSVRNVDIHTKKIFTLGERFFAGLNDCVIANAEAVREYVSDKHGIPRSKMHVIHNGVAMERVRPRREASGYATEAGVVGMIASLSVKKRHETFLRAARLVLESLPDTRFVVVGEGPLRQELESRAKELGISDAVCFRGSTEDVGRILAAIDVSVLTSVKEGCSNVILESMAAALPLVVTDAGGNRELVLDEVTGFIVPIDDAEAVAERIVRLLSDADLRRRMGEEGLKRVRERFSVRRMVDNTASFYMETLAGRVPGLVEWVETSAARLAAGDVARPDRTSGEGKAQ
jgi:glycosyltransferase involved in cell wall biosynthesis